jgi:hypothetical protein
MWRDIWVKNAKDPLEPQDMLRTSYRYLRLELALMALAILVAMVIEKLRSPGWEHAISAYYYTAARPIFTGAMIAIGGFLIAIKGRTHIEDISLNLAGMMAPLVPLIPPGQSSKETGSSISTVGFNITERQHHELLVNSMTTVLVIAVASFALVSAIGKLTKKPVELQNHDKAGLAIAAGVAAISILLYLNVDAVHDKAHPLSAALMFVFLWPAIVANAYSAPVKKYRTLYSAIAIAMVVFLLGVIAGTVIAKHWRHNTLVLEILELTPFLVYWVVQTFEQWKVGVEPVRLVPPEKPKLIPSKNPAPVAKAVS